MDKITQGSLFGDEVYRPLKRVKKNGFYDYDKFLSKFRKQKTTDDCYTPEPVYRAVVDFVRRHAVVRGEIVRPFYPGGDFENYVYPDTCTVIDNPPFSIISRIVRFYHHHNVPYFLFAPALTLFSVAKEVPKTHIVCGATIRYDNGAKIPTSFVSNMFGNTCIWVCSELYRMLNTSNTKPINKFVFDKHIVTSATLIKLIKNGANIKIDRKQVYPIRRLEALDALGTTLFGEGFLLSDSAVAEIAGAEKNNGIIIALSEKERKIVDELNRKNDMI